MLPLLFLAASQALASGLTSGLALDDLYLENAPSSPRPYIIPHYADSHAVNIGAQVYRFPVTGPSSGYAFTLMSTNAPGSDSLGVLPHIHQKHYENFFSFKGRFQLWAQKDEHHEQQGRLLTQGDYGSVPRNTTHTFQILDPDTEMVGVVVPGGFEDLFYTLGQNYSTGTNTPYTPAASNDSAATGPNSSIISKLQSLDVYAQLDFVPRRDFANGSAPSSSWHEKSNTLATPGDPYFVANNYGPKYLNSQHGTYQIVQPLCTPTQTQDVNFTMSTILINRPRKGQTTVPTWQGPGAAAFEVLEGSLKIQIGDYPVATLSMGDVAFIPAQTTYQYWTEGAVTKVLYVSSGHDGVDQRLIRAGKKWDYVAFPRY